MRFWTLEILGFLWSLPITILGGLYVLLCKPTKIERYHGLRFKLLCGRRFLMPKRFNGLSLGALVAVYEPLLWNHERFMRHEDEHRRQQFILGVLQPVLYLLFGAISGILYGSPYRANWFEVMARWKAGQDLEP